MSGRRARRARDRRDAPRGKRRIDGALARTRNVLRRPSSGATRHRPASAGPTDPGVSIVDLMGFVHELRNDFFERAAQLGWIEFTKDRGTSMHSFRETFLHLAYVEEQHVTRFCENRAIPWMPEVMNIPQDRYRNLRSVRARLRQVTAMGNARFSKWNSPEELAKPAVWVAAKRYPLRLSRASAMAQCVTEHLLHLGEVEAMLWQIDVEPPTTFWIDRRVLHGQWPPPASTLISGARAWAAQHRVPRKRTDGRAQRRPPAGPLGSKRAG